MYVGQIFANAVLYPALALFGTFYALAGFAKLSRRREWLDLPTTDWNRARLQLSLHLLCYPAFWLLSGPLWPYQSIAVPAFVVFVCIFGTALGRHWQVMAEGDDPRAARRGSSV